MTGQNVSHYEILDRIGGGGMGVVYRARDLKLDRIVALKFLSPELRMSESERRRFAAEARATSPLDHPNIGVVFDIDETPDFQTFIAMAYYPGETLKQKMASFLSLDRSIGLAIQIAQGLAKAHSLGIIHRDIKPSNIIVTTEGVPKIIDFGLAIVSGDTLSMAPAARGTPAYMSPEQALGQDVDARTDVWALGVMLYEMITGALPFPGGSATAILYEVVHHEPKRPREIRADVEPELERIVLKALAKNRDHRYASAAEIAHDLTASQPSLSATTLAAITPAVRPGARRRPVVIAAAALAVALAGGAVFLVAASERGRERAAADVARLTRDGDYASAFIRAKAGGSAITEEQWAAMSSIVTIESTPPGADIRWKNYSTPAAEWQRLGRSPLARIRIPHGVLRVEVSKEGFETFDGTLIRWTAGLHDPSVEVNLGHHGDLVRFDLHKAGELPSGMVMVPSGPFGIASGGFLPVPMDAYFIDKYEVTNQQYQEFVDKGGYRNRAYWKQRFVQDGRELTWEEAMRLFRDATNRPGPATWEGGAYPAGQQRYPVRGVSWYEAAAYAEFAGKSLPTLYHWQKAALAWLAPLIGPLSNFGGVGTLPVGASQGLGPFGTYDMAGNVKEWCWNEAQEGNRYILGGAWNEDRFAFAELDYRPPSDRSANNGFRCVRYSQALPQRFTAPVVPQERDFAAKPVSDDVFEIYGSMYLYEHSNLEPRVESLVENTDVWRKEKVTFRAAYGNERMTAYLFLPKSSKPPFQTVVFMPWASAIFTPSSDNLVCMEWLDFVIKSGRAVMYPVFQGTYERRIQWAYSPVGMRDRIVMWVKDLSRSIDYLETRPDTPADRLAFYGASMGANLGPFLAVERRVKAAVLADGGFWDSRPRPESDPVNFAPRVKIPVLTIGGRYDFVYAVDKVQNPIFRLFGTPEKDKRHVVLETSHYAMVSRTEVVREVLGWLDRYLGPVQ